MTPSEASHAPIPHSITCIGFVRQGERERGKEEINLDVNIECIFLFHLFPDIVNIYSLLLTKLSLDDVVSLKLSSVMS